MRKVLVLVFVAAALGGGAWYYYGSDAADAATPAGAAGGGAGGRGGGRGRGAATMAVETASASRHEVTEYITVVGNLIGEATVDVVPRIAGRIAAMSVKLGDRVAKGQAVAKVEDFELREQINQAQASLDVNSANVVQRENDLKVAETTLGRIKTQFERGLSAKQNLEDAEARVNATRSQVSGAQAQVAQTRARLEELKISLGNTNITSPVDGFVSRRNLDVGGFAGANTVILSVVDIGTVRMVANLVEKDFKRVQPGVRATVEVDAFQGEQFTGQVSRVSPVFDPATRTAQMEIEVPNPGFRLKPGMYARVRLTAERRADALTVPRNAIVDIGGKRGVFLADGETARFKEVVTGLVDADRIEVLDGLTEGTKVVTAGALALRDGDRITAAGPARGRGGRGQADGQDPGRGRGGQGPAPAGRQ